MFVLSGSSLRILGAADSLICRRISISFIWTLAQPAVNAQCGSDRPSRSRSAQPIAPRTLERQRMRHPHASSDPSLFDVLPQWYHPFDANMLNKNALKEKVDIKGLRYKISRESE
jgi:hypothetical protein